MLKLLSLVATGLCVVAADEGVYSVPLSHSWDGKPELAQAFIEKVQAHNARVYSKKASVANGALQPTALVEETSHGDELSNHQTFFTGQIHVGSNQQVFDVIFDTGSSKLVIPSTYCGQAGCLNHRQFDPAMSTSYVSCTSEEDRARGMYKAETTEYGSGSVTGVLGADVVRMASNCNIDKLVFGQIMEERGDIFLASAFDGVMGMGPPDPRFADEEEDVTYVIHKQNGLGTNNNKYSFYFTNRPSNKGELVFGGDGNNHVGEFTSLTSMNPDPHNWAYWEVEMTDVLVGGVSIGACSGSQKCTAILDTGTTLVVGPGRVLGTVNQRASVHSDCSNIADLPTVTFQLDGHNFELSPEDYVLSQPGQFWGGSSSCVSGFTNEDNPFDFQRSGALGLMKHSHNATVENTVFLQEEGDDDTVSLDDAKISHSKLSAGGMAQNLAAHRQKRQAAQAEVSYAQKRLEMKQVLENSAKREYSFERAKSTSGNARVILGITFLKKFVSVFDYDTGKIRLATAHHPANDAPYSASELAH